jgi:hypothetical protein
MRAMPRHLSIEALADVLEGRGSAEARGHAVTCDECARRVREAEETLLLAGRAEVPEPSPLYWEAFRQQVGQRIAEESPAFSWRRWWGPGLAVAAAATLAVVAFLQTPSGPTPSAAPVIPAWSALPEEDDVAFSILLELGPSEEDLAPLVAQSDAAHHIADLTQEESVALTEAFRSQPGGSL